MDKGEHHHHVTTIAYSTYVVHEHNCKTLYNPFNSSPEIENATLS